MHTFPSKTVSGPVPWPSTPRISPGLRDLLGRMLDKDPAARITPNEALQHPWILGVSRLSPPPAPARVSPPPSDGDQQQQRASSLKTPYQPSGSRRTRHRAGPSMEGIRETEVNAAPCQPSALPSRSHLASVLGLEQLQEYSSQDAPVGPAKAEDVVLEATASSPGSDMSPRTETVGAPEFTGQQLEN